MNSIHKLLATLMMGLFIASCSTITAKSDKSSAAKKTIDFKGLHKKAEIVASRSDDLEKYKMSEVSF